MKVSQYKGYLFELHCSNFHIAWNAIIVQHKSFSVGLLTLISTVCFYLYLPHLVYYRKTFGIKSFDIFML